MWILIVLLAPMLLFAAVCSCALAKRPLRSCGCIIVLGAKVHPDGRMSRSLRLRCNAAAQAWRRGAAERMILCGGRTGGAPRSEAAAMAEYLQGCGVPGRALLLEDQSRNTVENLRNAKAIMAREGFADAAIVTSDYHLQRAIWIARKFAIPACGIAAKSPGGFGTRLKNLLRECVSWCVFWYYEAKLKLRMK